MQRNNKRVLIIILCAVIIASIAFCLNYFFNKKEGSSVITDIQKINILNDLNNSINGNNISGKEQKDILKKIDSENLKDKITDAEKTNVLNSLNQ